MAHWELTNVKNRLFQNYLLIRLVLIAERKKIDFCSLSSRTKLSRYLSHIQIDILIDQLNIRLRFQKEFARESRLLLILSIYLCMLVFFINFVTWKHACTGDGGSASGLCQLLITWEQILSLKASPFWDAKEWNTPLIIAPLFSKHSRTNIPRENMSWLSTAPNSLLFVPRQDNRISAISTFLISRVKEWWRAKA